MTERASGAESPALDAVIVFSDLTEVSRISAEGNESGFDRRVGVSVDYFAEESKLSGELRNGAKRGFGSGERRVMRFRAGFSERRSSVQRRVDRRLLYRRR